MAGFKQFHSLLFFAMSIVSFFMSSSFAFVYTGTVTEHENNNRPIPGVLVSAGHSTYRTTTDAEGRFFLNVPKSGVRAPSQRLLSSGSSITWNTQNHCIDLSNAKETIIACAIYRLNGARLFFKRTSTTDLLISVPSLPSGVYILSFSLGDNRSFSWKLLATSKAGIISIPLPYPHLRNSTLASTELPGVQLIFRHDGYFPVDREMLEAAETLSITMKPDPRAYVFDETKIHTYRFTLTHDDSLSMERNARLEEFTPSEFYYDDTLFGKVGIRYKGSGGFFMPHCFDTLGNRSDYTECENVSLKIKFNKYNDTARFYAMKKLNLHAMGFDPGKMREMFAYGAFRDRGIYTCRTAFAKVYVNGVFRGLFTAVEELDGRFTKSRWPEYGDGNLYKEVWPAAMSKYYYLDALVTNNDTDDTPSAAKMVNLYKSLKASTPETFRTNVSPVLDMDYWLNYIVVDRAIHNCDGIMTWYTDGEWRGNHNYFFYEEETPGGKVWLIPWDLNATFHPIDPIVDAYDIPEWNVVPGTCGPYEVWGGDQVLPANCDKLTGLTAAALWPEFKAAGEQFLATDFKPERMKAKLDRLATLIAPIMENEPSVDKTTWENEIDDMRKALDILYRGFDDYLHDRVLAIDTSGFFTLYPADSGFSISRINNFEFSSDTSLPHWSSVAISKGSSISLAPDTVTPLWGMGCMRASFIFTPANTTKKYEEKAAIDFRFPAAADFNKLDSIRICLQCDAPRDCRIYLASDIYKKHDIDDTYGWKIYVTKKSGQFTLAAKDLSWPEGADDSAPDLLDSVKTAVTGIGLNPSPRFNSAGRLEFVPDSGFIKIDNVVFIFR